VGENLGHPSGSSPGQIRPAIALHVAPFALPFRPSHGSIRRNARAIGVAEASEGQKPVRVVAMLKGDRDPGYWDTARMLLESALCLALQVHRVSPALSPASGLLPR
jgi:hypothetical protein